MATTLEELQSKIQGIILQRKARVTESFTGFDRHNSKKVTFAQAIRALNTFCKVDLTATETELLRAYLTTDGQFRYQDFADDIDKGVCRGALPC
jgi:Ca2+-binding EF-hand superfamily protein